MKIIIILIVYIHLKQETNLKSHGYVLNSHDYCKVKIPENSLMYQNTVMGKNL